MLTGFSILVILCMTVLFAGFASAIVLAFFDKDPSYSRYRLAVLWTVLLLVGAVGCRLVSETFGDGAAAAFSVLACVSSALLTFALSRFWEKHDVLAAVAYMQAHRAVVDGYRIDLFEGLCEREISSNEGVVDVGVAAGVPDSGCDEPPPSDSACGSGLASNPDPLLGFEPSGKCGSSSKSDPAIVCAMASRTYDLTRREEEVLRLLLDGKSFAAIAGELFISDNTVKTHVRHIYRKMGVNRKEGLSEKVHGSVSASE